MTALVSVIVPCHNRTEYLTACLDSIRIQSYPEIEVIVVDDASTEDIVDAVGAISWPRGKQVRVIRSDNNVGPGQAREIGRRAANGAFICYQDSDDWWLPDKVAAQVETLEENPSAGMCYCIARQTSGWPVTGTETVRPNSDVAHTDFLPLLLETRRRPWGTGACMWARWATDRIGPWFPGWTWEDMEYDCRAGCHDISIVHLAESLCYYRTHTGMNQLRQTAVRTRMVQMSASILAISRSLAEHGKLAEPRVASVHQWLLYDHSMVLLRVGAVDAAENLVQRLRQTTTRRIPARVAADILLRIQYVTRSPVLAGTLGRSFGLALQRLAQLSGAH